MLLLLSPVVVIAAVTSPVVRAGSVGRRLLADATWSLTCRLADMQPLQLGVDVEIRQSPGRGDGVFALRQLEPGTLVGRYEGALLRDDQYSAMLQAGETSGDYAFDLDQTGWVVDGEDRATSSWQRYCNHSVRRQNCVAGACRAFGQTLGIYLEVSRPIQAGEEMFFDYGRSYWDSELGNRFLRRLVVDFL